MLASEGYPVQYEKGKVITGIDQIDENAVVFHAGTIEKNGEIVTNGGRVLNVVGNGNPLKGAVDHTYKNADYIQFSNTYIIHVCISNKSYTFVLECLLFRF